MPVLVPHREVHDLAPAESDQRVARRQLQSVDELALSAHDVEYRPPGTGFIGMVRILSVKIETPANHMTEEARWDYRAATVT